IVFHRVIADRPASSAPRKPSSVSSSGVLIDMPVTTTWLAVDKVDLHESERAQRAAAPDLARAERGEVVHVDGAADQRQVVARHDRLLELRVLDAHRARVARTRAGVQRGRAGGEEVQQAQPELADDLELQHARVYRPARKMPAEHRIAGIDPAPAANR